MKHFITTAEKEALSPDIDLVESSDFPWWWIYEVDKVKEDAKTALIGNYVDKLILKLCKKYHTWRKYIWTPYPNIKKSIIVRIPHTHWRMELSNMINLHKEFQFKNPRAIAKKSLKWIFSLMPWTYPCIYIDRKSPKWVVNLVKEAFLAAESMTIFIAPEWTRRPNISWKYWYHAMAVAADAPVRYVLFDTNKKMMHVSDPQFLSWNKHDDVIKANDWVQSIGTWYDSWLITRRLKK